MRTLSGEFGLCLLLSFLLMFTIAVFVCSVVANVVKTNERVRRFLVDVDVVVVMSGSCFTLFARAPHNTVDFVVYFINQKANERSKHRRK